MIAPAAQTPDAMDLGGLMLVVPNVGTRLTRRTWADVAMATILHGMGRDEPANDLIAGVERRLGVNDAHRRAVHTSPDTVRREIREAARRRMLESAHLAATAGAPVRDAEIAEKIDQALARAAAARAKAKALETENPRKHRRDIKDLLKRAGGLEREALKLRGQEADQDKLYGEAREPILMAKARGEDVTAGEAETADFARDQYGARIIERRRGPRGEFYYVPALVYGRGLRAKKTTGIEHAFGQGYLDGGRGSAEALYEAGQRYAEAYEVDEGLTGSSGEGAGGFGPKGPQVRQVEAGETLAIMRRKLEPRGRQALDLVCGEGLRARDVAAKLGMGFPAFTRLLRASLRQAGDSWVEACRSGEAGQAARRAALGARVLKRIRV